MLTLKLDKNKKYLLACSGGPDSMFLFTLLKNEGYNFSVAHVNYHFREESDLEEAKLREHCEINNVELFVLNNKEVVKSNLEEKAREIRYAFFKSIYDQYGFDALLIAHNKDDKLETYLLQKQRKNLPIFYGIKEENVIDGMVVSRPLLNIYKEDIVKYLDNNHIPYSIDKTNFENLYQRNKIRNEILSHYSREKKEALDKEICCKNEELSLLECKLNSIDKNSIKSLLELSDIELAYSLNKTIRESLLDYECSMSFVKEIRKVLESPKSNVIIPLKDSFVLSKEYDSLFVRDLSKSFDPIVISSPCLIDNEFFYFDLVKRGKDKGITENDYPLIIRPAKSGDRYRIKNYDCSVNRLFIDWKMPLYLRKIWPVFEHDGRIVYIPRYQKNFDVNDDKYFFIKYVLL